MECTRYIKLSSFISKRKSDGSDRVILTQTCLMSFVGENSLDLKRILVSKFGNYLVT